MRGLILAGIALLVRLALVAYGEWHDAHNLLKYTDIDYEVVNDGAMYVWNGQSPYLRSTYRYTPLLAWLLTLNHGLHLKCAGKLLFSVADILVGVFMLMILQPAQPKPSSKAQQKKSLTFGLTREEWLASITWFFNPLVIGISTRGNSESLVAFLVLATAYFLMENKTSWAGIFYALAVHFKIYPVIFALSIVIYLYYKHGRVLFNRDLFLFALVSGIVFVSLTGMMYKIYGYEFLDNAYLYHIGRRDHRHNFSLYHLYIYLTFEQPSSIAFSLASFGPQALLLAAISVVYAKTDILFSWFLLTFIFVSYNKVCTSQYFIWFISLIPFALVNSKIKFKWRGLSMLVFWILGQAIWLSQAYRLEMLGENTFLNIWMAGILFFLVNNSIIIQFIRYQDISPMKSKSN